MKACDVDHAAQDPYKPCAHCGAPPCDPDDPESHAICRGTPLSEQEAADLRVKLAASKEG